MANCLMKVLTSLYANEIEEKTHFTTKDFQQLLPKPSSIENVLHSKSLMTLNTFFHMFNLTSLFDHYDEKVWPIPNDLTPDFVYTNEKYDVNMIFGKNGTE